MNEWQPIETAPKDGTPILMWDGDMIYVISWYVPQNTRYPAQWREADGKRYCDYDPTHWMPLPEPPK